MSSNTSPLRRLFWLLLLAAAGGAAYAWWRERTAVSTLAEPPAWPPIESTPEAATEPLPSPDPTTGTERPAPAWLKAEPDGSCPEGYPIKANETSGIFHVPGGRFYAGLKHERCYANADAALADGYRQSKS
jgi:hypothetical protein